MSAREVDMGTIYIETSHKPKQLESLVRSAIDGEIVRLELSLELAKDRLLPFEKRYGVSSATFSTEFAAEDLRGGDDEYVQWAGEYRLMQRLEEKLTQLRIIALS